MAATGTMTLMWSNRVRRYSTIESAASADPPGLWMMVEFALLDVGQSLHEALHVLEADLQLGAGRLLPLL